MAIALLSVSNIYTWIIAMDRTFEIVLVRLSVIMAATLGILMGLSYL